MEAHLEAREARVAEETRLLRAVRAPRAELQQPHEQQVPRGALVPDVPNHLAGALPSGSVQSGRLQYSEAVRGERINAVNALGI